MTDYLREHAYVHGRDMAILVSIGFQNVTEACDARGILPQTPASKRRWEKAGLQQLLLDLYRTSTPAARAVHVLYFQLNMISTSVVQVTQLWWDSGDVKVELMYPTLSFPMLGPHVLDT